MALLPSLVRQVHLLPGAGGGDPVVHHRAFSRQRTKTIQNCSGGWAGPESGTEQDRRDKAIHLWPLGCVIRLVVISVLTKFGWSWAEVDFGIMINRHCEMISIGLPIKVYCDKGERDAGGIEK